MKLEYNNGHPVCPYCGAIQVWTRRDNGVVICCNHECKKELPKQEKKPETPYVPMDKYGRSKKLGE